MSEPTPVYSLGPCPTCRGKGKKILAWERTCEGCGQRFRAKRRHRRTCSERCRKRIQRQR